ncbi:MAG: hypothetical protein E3J72_08315 [Planctomycetota bacterium]|nr:MAG: hypothetical protein E3J72_08315 [Planctomycetota bacterium]
MHGSDEVFVDGLAAKYSLPEDEQAVIEELYGHARTLESTKANEFLFAASEKLGTRPLHLNVIDFSSKKPNTIRVAVDADEVQILADTDGIAYIRALLEFLADSTSDFEFVHIGEPTEVLRKGSLYLTISRVREFPEIDHEETPLDLPLLPQYDIDVTSIFALQFIDLMPNVLPITAGRIYRIESILPEAPLDVWKKAPLSSDNSRNINVMIISDIGEPTALVICLDDPGVLFFTREEFEHLLAQ